jgi:hypothetical protein
MSLELFFNLYLAGRADNVRRAAEGLIAVFAHASERRLANGLYSCLFQRKDSRASPEYPGTASLSLCTRGDGSSRMRAATLELGFDLNYLTCLIHLAWQFSQNWPGWQPPVSGAPTKWISADGHPRSGLLSFAIL